MLKKLFSKTPKALTAACAVILFIEIALAGFDQSQPDFYGGTAVTWRFVKQLEAKTMDLSPEVILMGDSTAGVLDRKLKGSGINDLALKIWDGMPAQFFLLKRYIQAGGRPKVCMLMTDLRVWDVDMRTALDHAKAADSFFRPLGNWANSADLLWSAQRPDLAWAMLKESFLPSRRFKIPLAGLLARAGIYPSEIVEKDPFADEKGDIAQFEVWKKRMTERADREDSRETLAEYYFKRIAGLCRQHNIQLVVYHCPIYEDRKKEVFQYERRMRRIREFLKKEGIPFREDSFIYPKAAFDSVGSHVQAEPELSSFAEAILRQSREWLASAKTAP